MGATTTLAVPYASSVVKSGDTVSYVLNQDAVSVEVILDGGAPIPMGTSAGTYSFDMPGKTSYQIKVTGNATPVWTQFIPDGPDRNYYVPIGVSVDKNPGSPNFGKVFVSNATTGTTGAGRNTPEGLYALRADGVADIFGTAGVTWGGGSGPFKSSVGQDGHLYVADLSNDLCYDVSPDLQSAVQLIDDSNKTTGQYVNSIYVEGTQAAGNRKIYLINGNNADTARKGLISYTLDGNATATSGDPGTQIVGPGVWYTYYPYDVARDSSGNFYINTYRSTANQAPPIMKFDAAGNKLWEAPMSYAGGPYGIDIDENSGRVAYIAYDNGIVYFFDMNTGAFIESFDAGTRGREVAFDPAGNLITVDNTVEYARFWSPGGYTIATTAFDGASSSFQITRPEAQVSVVANQATVPEAGPAATFTISRAVTTGSDLTVSYVLSGTATNGSDYTTLSGTAVIPANAASVAVTLSPTDDPIAELTETVTLTLTASSSYSVVAPAAATVSILDNEPVEVAFTAAAGKKLLESYSPSRVTHQLVRRGSIAGAVTVNIAYSGAATLAADYTAPATVSMAAGAATANLVLAPVNDQSYEPDEAAIATVAAGSGYAPSATDASITATVINDDPPPGTLLFADDFEADSSALWQQNIVDSYDSFVEFAWDYSAAGIPPAPGATSGTTKGLRMRTGNTISQNDGLSLSPLNKSFTGDYRLKFDMWINYNGPLANGGPGSTQNFDAGVGTSGTTPIWQVNSGSDCVWFSVAGDGESENDHGGDYYALIGGSWLTDETGVYAAGVGETPDSGMRDATHPYYSLWGGQTAPTAQLQAFPGQTGTVDRGTAGMAWHTVVITRIGNVVTWAIDGITIATVTNTALPFGENVFVGYQDVWAGGSVSDVPEMSFGLVDNLRVQTLTPPAAPVITGIQLVNGGSQVKITFTAGASDLPGAFSLVGSSTLTGTFNGVAASITSPAAGQFEALTAVGAGNQFFRVRRN